MAFYGGSIHQSGSMHLQSTISAATSGIGETIMPHHPICCPDGLYYDEDNNFGCAHSEVPADDPRTQAGLNHSLVLLLLEPAVASGSEWRFKTREQLEYEWEEKYGVKWDESNSKS